ncbi:MAG: crossover junction endodeoxyribonuclease RuvC [Thermodesulfobacteriota bacterium]
MLVLGVDPGSLITGYGLVEKSKGRIRCVDAGMIRAPSSVPFPERIHGIFRTLVEIMGRNEPREMAIEEVFFAKNPKSALKIGHARGAALVAAVECGMRVFEYSATEIKQSVVGYGRAPKEQVRSMVGVILGLDFQPSLDTSDALAAAICHLHTKRFDPAPPAG